MEELGHKLSSSAALHRKCTRQRARIIYTNKCEPRNSSAVSVMVSQLRFEITLAYSINCDMIFRTMSCSAVQLSLGMLHPRFHHR